MMTVNDPYFRIVSLEADDAGCRAEVVFSPDHPLYAGHFPGRPVVPGVVVLQVVRALIREAWEMDTRIRSGQAIKYLRPMLPDASLQYGFQLSLTERTRDRLTLNADIRQEGQVCTRIRDMVCAVG